MGLEAWVARGDQAARVVLLFLVLLVLPKLLVALEALEALMVRVAPSVLVARVAPSVLVALVGQLFTEGKERRLQLQEGALSIPPLVRSVDLVCPFYLLDCPVAQEV